MAASGRQLSREVSVTSGITFGNTIGVNRLQSQVSRVSNKPVPPPPPPVVENRSFWYGIINKEWLALKFLFFFKYGAMGAMLPYYVVYYRARRLTPAQIGLIESIVHFGGIIARAGSAMIADKLHKHRLILAICLFIFSVFNLGLVLIREPTKAHYPIYPVTLHCQDHTDHVLQVRACNSSALILRNMTQFSPIMFLSSTALSIKKSKKINLEDCEMNGDHCQLSCKSSVFFDPRKADMTLEQTITDGDSCSTFEIHPKSPGPKSGPVCTNTTDSLVSCHMNCLCSANRSLIDFVSAEDGKYVDSQSDFGRTETFIMVAILRVVSSLFHYSTFSVEDALAYEMLGQGNKRYWGQQKMFGPMSMGLVGLLAGMMIDAIGNFNIAFFIYGVLNAAAIVVTLVWMRQPHLDVTEPHIKRPDDVHFTGTLRKMCKIPLFFITCIVAVLSGVFVGIIFVIWPQWLLQLGATNSMLGIFTACASTVDAAGLFVSGQFVHKFGNIVCFLLMFITYAVRFLLYSFLTPSTVWFALPLELTQFFTYAIFYAALTQFAATVAPRGMSATVQAILGACYLGIGMSFGNMATSAVYSELGGFLSFNIFAIAAGVCFVLLLILHFVYLRKLPTIPHSSSFTVRQPSVIERQASRQASKIERQNSARQTPLIDRQTSRQTSVASRSSNTRQTSVIDRQTSRQAPVLDRGNASRGPNSDDRKQQEPLISKA